MVFWPKWLIDDLQPNSTNNLILTEMERGTNRSASRRRSRRPRTARSVGCGGIAETDPSFDVDGWDATVKVSALATVLTLASAIAAGASAGVDYPLRPNDIAREGIRGVSMEAAQTASM